MSRDRTIVGLLICVLLLVIMYGSGRRVTEFEREGCEYLQTEFMGEISVTHKGNCRNH